MFLARITLRAPIVELADDHINCSCVGVRIINTRPEGIPSRAVLDMDDFDVMEKLGREIVAAARAGRKLQEKRGQHAAH